MHLNDIGPAPGATHARKRVGRGIGSGLGKTAGRGHKGQRSRSGGFHKVGFEGGQMPLQRRLPKRGFISLTRGDTAEVPLSALAKLAVDSADLAALKAAGIVPHSAAAAKVILSGTISRSLKLEGIRVSKGAKAAIEAAGGSVVMPAVAKPQEGSKKAQRLVDAVAKKAAREKAAKEPAPAPAPKAKKSAKGEAAKESPKQAAKRPAGESGKESGKGKKG